MVAAGNEQVEKINRERDHDDLRDHRRITGVKPAASRLFVSVILPVVDTHTCVAASVWGGGQDVLVREALLYIVRFGSKKDEFPLVLCYS